ncbi:MAG: DUF2283 domain-containing protein [Candidatus Anammoxibacter sp.]
MGKSKVKVWCDEEADILYMSFKEGPSVDSEETEEGVRVEYGSDGEIVGVEVSDVSRLLAQPLIRKIEEGIPGITDCHHEVSAKK